MNIKSIALFAAVTLGLLIGVGALLTQFGQNSDQPIADVAGNKRHTQGEGVVTLVEFSDFQCPACQGVQSPLKQIIAKFPGEVRLVYRHFPLSTIHKNAQAAAQASEAAHMQGKFFEFHDLLFAKQNEWSELDDPTAKFGEYSESIGLDKNKFLSDMESAEAKEAVLADSQAANQYRLNGTPTFFVNGVKTEFNQIESKIVEMGSSK
jgi:protein-disulfide isomerase